MLRTATNDTRTRKYLCALGTFVRGTLVAIFHDHLAALVPNVIRGAAVCFCVILAWIMSPPKQPPANPPSAPTGAASTSPAAAPTHVSVSGATHTPAPGFDPVSLPTAAPLTAALKPLEPLIELPHSVLRPTVTLQVGYVIRYSEAGWGLPAACHLRVEQDGNARFITFTHWRWEFRSFDDTVIVAHSAPLDIPIKLGAGGAVTSFHLIDREIIQQFNAHHLGNHAHAKQVATLKLTLTGVDDQGQIIEATHQL